jgi:hyperosmotically inducible protein
MRYKVLVMCVAISVLIFSLGCSHSRKSPNVKAGLEKALSQAGLSSVKVSQDREKGVITLSGDVHADADKQKAEDVAKTFSNSLVISNQIGVRPPGFESEAKQVDSSLDTAIEKNLEAIFVEKGFNQGIQYTAKNGVLTLTGKVNSITRRNELAQLAGSVPNVLQVVNELQIVNIKATSTKK